MNLNIRNLLFYLILPFILFFTINIFIGNMMKNEISLNLIILIYSFIFIISSISGYMIDELNGDLKIYYLNLILSVLWFIFINIKILNIIYSIFLILILFINYFKFKKINKLSGYLIIPEIIFLIIICFLLI